MKEHVKDIKFRMDMSDPEQTRVVEFLDTLGKGYRVRWLLACAQNFLEKHPTEVRRMLENTREVHVVQRAIPVNLESNQILEKPTEINEGLHDIENKKPFEKKGMMRGLVK